MQNINPSDTKNWDVVRHLGHLSNAAKNLQDPKVYAYYLLDGRWTPIRRPTVSEIINNKYK